MEQQIACFGCGRKVGTKYSDFKALTRAGVSERDALTDLGLQKDCCRMTLMGATEASERLMPPADLNLIESPARLFSRSKLCIPSVLTNMIRRLQV